MSTRKERADRKKLLACPGCGGEGPHFVPPGAGMNGFFLCNPPEDGDLTNTSRVDIRDLEKEVNG